MPDTLNCSMDHARARGQSPMIEEDLNRNLNTSVAEPIIDPRILKIVNDAGKFHCTSKLYYARLKETETVKREV